MDGDGHSVSFSRLTLSPPPRCSPLLWADLWGLCQWEILPSRWVQSVGAPTGDQRVGTEWGWATHSAAPSLSCCCVLVGFLSLKPELLPGSPL